MPSAIERDLTTLLPTKSVTPPQVTALATSLLAQSRAIASKLKPQEEIAREYACAHIACERLTNKLALEIGQIMPPCAPRVYNKLHRYLDGVLTAGKVVTSSTPRAKTAGSAPSVTKQSPRTVNISSRALDTPSKTSKIAPPSSLKRKRADIRPKDQIILPEHLSKLGHHLCRTANLPAAIPHVYAGLERTYGELDVTEQVDEPQISTKRARKLTTKAEKLLPRNSRLPIETEKLPLVVVAVAHQAMRKMRTMEVVATDPEHELEMLLSEALSSLQKEDAESTLRDEPLESLLDQIKHILPSLQSLSFWQDWLANVPILQAEEEEEMADIEDADSLLPQAYPKKTPLRRKEKHGNVDEELGMAGLLPGLGTMFQPAFDWLSDERVADYARWERDIRQRLAAV